jgi:ABC-2 type transport system ATP-binding protein
MIKTVELSKTYANGFHAVHNMNFDVEEGDIFGFLGPNGAGKTTTIRMLTGLLVPTSGQVFVDGKDVSKEANTIKSQIGVLPESHGYYNWMTAFEYLQHFYRLFQMDPKQETTKINTLLQKVGLFDRAHTRVGEFSRGMKQRLGIAKTLINNPKIIFLDEPTLGLDPAGQQDIHKLILELNKNYKITVFITSHLLKDIEVLCNKIAIVKHGNLLVCDTISNLQDEYAPYDVIHVNTGNNEKALNALKTINAFYEMKLSEQHIEISILKGSNLDMIKKNIIETLIMSKIDIFEIRQVNITVETLFMNVVNSKEQGGQ